MIERAGENTVIVRRSKPLILALLVGFGFITVLWLLAHLGVLKIEGGGHLLYSSFILLFGAVFILFCVIWKYRNRPMMILGPVSVELRSGIRLSHSLTIKLEDILEIRTSYRGPNQDYEANLIFRLKHTAAEDALLTKVLRQENAEWSFDFSTAEINPPRAIELIEERKSRLMHEY